MLDPLFRKGIRDLRGQVFGWGLGMGAMLALTAALFPSIGNLYGDIMDSFPEEWAGFIGDFSTLEGYLSIEFFSYAHIALAVFAILAGGAAIVGEETGGTMDLLLAQPVSRLRVAVAKLTALTVSIVAIVGLTGAGLLVTVPLIGGVDSPWRLANGFLLLLPFLVGTAFAASLFAQVFGSRMAGGTILAGLLVASYMLEAMSGVNQTLTDLSPAYLTTYFQGHNAVIAEIEWGYLIVSLLATAVFAVANVVLFVRRDIAAGALIRLPKLRLPGRAHAA
ncbi:MAG: ABC transporter permease subunit [Chloroflexi bacterium]|nr:ABC transporter permease subunit [Chloroflexota bacterium]